MVGHTGAIVVFGFVIDGGHRHLSGEFMRDIAAWSARWQVAAVF
jgi:hypothetical protein